MDNKTKTFERVFVRLAPILIFVAGILLILALLQINETKYAVKETAAYTRVSNCIVAKSGTSDRTFESVEECYVQVEKDSGIPLERFDKQINNEGSYE